MCKLCVITTVSTTIKVFYKGQLEALKQAGFDITVICANDEELNNQLPENVKFYPVPFSRKIRLFGDIKAVIKLMHIFEKEQFDLVQYSTPKASLLGAIAAFLAKVPVRIYLLWGLYYEGQKGFARLVLRQIEKLICGLSTHIMPNGKELIAVIKKEGLATMSKCEVLLNGSACGVDLNEFCPAKWRNEGNLIRYKFSIPNDGIVIGVFSRLTGDKGINEIVAAFVQLSDEFENLFLLIVGTHEEKDRLPSETLEIMESHPKIKCLGWQETLLPCWAAIDIYCLPSYREGFPQSPLEAQAMEKPVVCTDITGCRESIENGITGFLVKSHSSEVLLEPLRKLIYQPELRVKIGKAGRQRVIDKFDSKEMIKAVVEHRLNLISELRRK